MNLPFWESQRWRFGCWLTVHVWRIFTKFLEDRAGELARLLEERRSGLRLLHQSCMPSKCSFKKNIAAWFVLGVLLQNFSTCKNRLSYFDIILFNSYFYETSFYLSTHKNMTFVYQLLEIMLPANPPAPASPWRMSWRRRRGLSRVFPEGGLEKRTWMYMTDSMW